MAHQRSGDTFHWGPLGGVERTDFAHSEFFAFRPGTDFVKRTHPLQTICTKRTVADADARNPND
jgi:hypothetical protein